jgi:hypothetical protein
MGPAVELDPADRGLVESAIRNLADRVREIDLDDVLNVIAVATRSEVMNRFYEATYQARGGKAGALGLRMGHAERELAEANRDRPMDDAQARSVFDYTVLLVIADELAGDDYRDPRIPA